MNFADYERGGQRLYGEFAEAIASILKVALASKPDLQLQEVQFRAKDPGSLGRKLENRQLADCPEIADEIKDLAGCRLIFYTNTDVEAFAQSRLLHENFDVDYDRTKIHYPTGQGDDANALFISDNYVIRLKPNRAELPEYARFAGLRCEVQVQTILNHAWAQMAHDTIYKKPIEKGFGTAIVEGINARLAKVMRDHLLPAGYEFQKITSDYRRLLAGKDMFDAGALATIRGCGNLNDLHETIERFGSHVLPNYDDIEAVFPDVSDTLVDAAERALAMPEIPYDTGWGEYPGEKRETILSDVCGILSHLRYIDIDRSLDTVLRLAGQIDGAPQRKALDGFASKLAEHNLTAWKKVGGAFQAHLVERIGKLDDQAVAAALPTLTTMLTQVLKSTVTGTSYKPDAIVLHQGAVPASVELISARRGAIEQLKRFYPFARTDEERAEILHGLSSAGETPMNSGYSNALGKVIMDDLAVVVAFYHDIAPGMSLEDRRKLEERLFRHYYSYSKLPPDMADDADLAAASAALVAEIQAGRAVLNGDPDFVIYKTLVGFDSVSERMWEDCSYDYRIDGADKDDEVEQLARSVSPETIDEWVDRLNRYAETESNDLATFSAFGTFLQRLAEYQPDLIDAFLARMNERLGRFLPALLHGLAKAGHQERLNAYIDSWIAAGQHLGNVGWYLQAAIDFDEERLVRLLDRAFAADDANAVFNCNLAAIRQYEALPGGLIDRVFLPCIEYLTARDELSWLGFGFFTWRKQAILRGLDEAQSRRVLDAMFLAPDLERRGEELLAGIAEAWPDLVLDFLRRRLVLAAGDTAPEKFSAIPYSLHALNKPLSRSPDRLISAVRSWFDADKSLFEFRGARLVHTVFPDFPPELEARLRAEIDRGDALSAEFVIEILRTYDGKDAMFPLCRDIVATLDPEDPLIHSIRLVLYASGVLTGEHGSALALAEKRTALAAWLEDPREAVRIFAERFIYSLEQSMAQEYRQADQRMAMRNLAYSE